MMWECACGELYAEKKRCQLCGKLVGAWAPSLEQIDSGTRTIRATWSADVRAGRSVQQSCEAAIIRWVQYQRGRRVQRERNE